MIKKRLKIYISKVYEINALTSLNCWIALLNWLHCFPTNEYLAQRLIFNTACVLYTATMTSLYPPNGATPDAVQFGARIVSRAYQRSHLCRAYERLHALPCLHALTVSRLCASRALIGLLHYQRLQWLALCVRSSDFRQLRRTALTLKKKMLHH